MIALMNSPAWRWRTIASITAASVGFLALSLATSERLAAILAAFGLMGLMLLRLLALHGRWPPRRHRRGT